MLVAMLSVWAGMVFAQTTFVQIKAHSDLSLRAQRAIAADSFPAESNGYSQQFWPNGASTLTPRRSRPLPHRARLPQPSHRLPLSNHRLTRRAPRRCAASGS